MLAVERHLSRGYEYSESPPPSKAPLESFLFRDKVGYCQQFSGAMALLLRFGGVPARVAAGFSPGVYDAKRKEFVVRDLDAHSWVEVFYPSIGWITRDPTPSASPARSQTDDLGRAAQNADVDVSDGGGAGGDGPASSAATGGPAKSGDGGGSALLVDRARARGRRRRRARAGACDRRHGGACPRASPTAAPASSPSCSGRCAAPGARPRCRRRSTRWPRAIAARPPRTTCARSRPRATATATPARRRPSAPRCAASWRSVAACGRRLRAWWALPPQPSLWRLRPPRCAEPAEATVRYGVRRILDGWPPTTSTSCFRTGCACSRSAITTRPPSRWPACARSSPTRPRSARRSAGRCSARSATARPRRSSRPSSTARRCNDYAQFCLGRCLQQLGRHAEARAPLALACCLRPERADYRLYRDRARANSAKAA